MESDTTSDEFTTSSPARRVLNAGSGSLAARQLHAAFRAGWDEVRLDVDPSVAPDVVGSVTDMRSDFADGTFDAVWSSHVMEHLYGHEVLAALSEMRRILRTDGFALITSPDLETVAELVCSRGLDDVIYVSAAGPITPLDMIFGHNASVARGREPMAHRTGFSCASLGNFLVEAGFASVLAKREIYDLWALALMPDADAGAVVAMLREADLDFGEDVAEAA